VSVLVSQSSSWELARRWFFVSEMVFCFGEGGGEFLFEGGYKVVVGWGGF